METFKKNIGNFMELTRAYSIHMTIASCLVLFSYAYYCEKFSFINFVLLFIVHDVISVSFAVTST